MILISALLCLASSLTAALGPKAPTVRPNGIVTYNPPTAGVLDGAAFAKWVVAQASDNVKKMALKKGAYHVKPSGQSGSHIFLSSLNGVTIWMDGVNLTMTNPAYQAFQFYVCKNLTTYGPTIWWDTPGFSQATITAVQALDSTGQNFNVTFRPDDGYNSSFLLDPVTGSVNGDYTDPSTGRLQAGPGFSTVQGIATEGHNNSWTIPLSNSYFLPIVGWKLVARGNFLFCNLIAYSNNTTVNDFTILNCGGFGFLSNVNTQTTFNSLSIKPAPFAPTGGTQLPVRASSADGVHSTDDFVGPTFDSCLFTALDDDCIAIHGTLNAISSISNSLSISGSSSLINTRQSSVSVLVSTSSSTSTPTSASWPCSTSSTACDPGPILSPTQLAKVVSGSSTYNLLGCMQIASTENKIPISYSNGGALVDNGMTIEECASKALGSFYFGLTMGVQCIWGASLTLYDYPIVPISSCNSVCLGDSSESCGAENLLQVYSSKSSDDSLKVDSKVTPGEVIDPAIGSTSLWKYQGCYSYGFNGNLGNYASATTLEGCADFCSSKGASAMSLKYASYCYCGYMETCTTRYCDSLCQPPCVGNGSEACGSDYYSVVYSLDDDPPASSSLSVSSTSASSSSSPSASSASNGQGPVTFVAPSGPVFVGAILRFYSSSGVWSPLGTATVTKISGNTPTTITVDNMPAGVDVTSSWVNTNQTGSGFSITNTQAGNNRGRGAIIKASNGVIANNLFVGVAYAGLDIGPEFTYWGEADYVSNILLTNNTIDSCNYLDKATAAFMLHGDGSNPLTGNKNITINTLTIRNTSASNLYMGATSGVSIKNVVFQNAFSAGEADQLWETWPAAVATFENVSSVNDAGAQWGCIEGAIGRRGVVAEMKSGNVSGVATLGSC